MDQSVTNQHTNNAQGYDKLSHVPDDPIHRVFSFLKADEIARATMLSKRLRQSVFSSPYLKFDCTCKSKGQSCLCEGFIKYVDRIMDRMASQKNELGITSFRLHWLCFIGDNDVNRDFVDKWINIAVSREVRELDLEVGSRHEEQLFKPPDCIFSSRSLRVLKLCMTYHFLEEPIGVFASLEDLSLYNLGVEDNCLDKWISTACPSLKRLTIGEIFDASFDVRIASESLEELDIFKLPSDTNSIDISTERLQKLSLDLLLYHSHDCTLKVKAPNLQYFRWMGTVSDIYLSEWKYLEEATLCLHIDSRFLEDETTCNRLAKFLQSVHRVRVLQINSDVFEMLFLCNRLPVVLDNLRHLDITFSRLMDYHFTVFASVLMVSRKLETLSLKGSRIQCPSHFKMVRIDESKRSRRRLNSMASKFYEQHEGFHNLIGDQLSAIEIELKGKFRRAWFVVENLVKVAKGLKKITIFYWRLNSGTLSRIREDILKMASQHLEVNLVEKNLYGWRSSV